MKNTISNRTPEGTGSIESVTVTMVTSDRGFKAVLSEENIPVFDPNKVA